MQKTEVKLNIEGMTCSNCALGISRFLEKKGAEDISVDFSTAEARFKLGNASQVEELKSGIEHLGYKVLDNETHRARRFEFNLQQKFFICMALTLPLLLHMFIHNDLLSNPFFQLAFCLPVYIIGAWHFGRSAYGSLLAGVPNMDVLIIMGSSAAFFYSLYGTINQMGHDFLFYETAASIITIVLLGNLLEQKSVKQTTTALRELANLKPQQAKLIIENGKEAIKEVDASTIIKGQKVLINTGDRVPADGKIIWGACSVDESIASGESSPVEKNEGDELIGGTLVLQGTVKVAVTATGSDSFLANIIELVKKAQQKKPDIQRLADQVSAWFVPTVIIIAVLTFFITTFALDKSFQQALINSVAVLVIACPCAMGLATPTAVMVGLGMITKRGILVKGGKTLESLSRVKQIVFDKTGTLTTGNFRIRKIKNIGVSEDELKSILFSLEKYSSHPIATSIALELKAAQEMTFSKVKEEKGIGVTATDKKGNVYNAGSYHIARMLTVDNNHDVYVLRNNVLIGYVDIEDELKPEAKSTIEYLKKKGITPIMLSGDSYRKCAGVARYLEIEKFFFNKSPKEKMEIISALSKEKSTAMVGDGINDAPALALADVGISLSDATEVAIDSAQIILLKGNLSHLKVAIEMSKATISTIKQNLFWAFFYNILAIPIAAAGFLSPIIAAFAMALSDVFVVGNSLRLKTRKV